MQDGYLAGGYETREIGFGERPAILVIDFQMSHTSRDYPYGGTPEKISALENIVGLQKLARARGVPVILCNTAYKDERDMPYWKIANVRDRYRFGDPAVDIDPRLVDPAYDFIFTKPGVSMFYETPLQHYLIKQRVDTVIVTGVHTSGCIRMTTVDSFQRGYRTIVPHDCVADIAAGPHEDNLRDVRRRYADVVDCAKVRGYLEGLPASR